MKKTQITIETFKESGKWYDIIKFETDTPAHDTNKIIKECKVVAQKGMSFTFEAESPAGGLNKRMVLVAADENYQIIQAKTGSLIITPEELEAFKYFNINIAGILEKIQAYMKKFM